MRILVLAVCLAGMAACTVGTASWPSGSAAVAVPGPTVPQLVAARIAGMHMAATLLFTDVRRVVDGHEDVRQHVHEPEGIALWAAAIPGLFPDGSFDRSRAVPTIAQNRADFDQKARDLEAAATELARRGAAGDAADYAAQARTVMAACNACHQAYRVTF